MGEIKFRAYIPTLNKVCFKGKGLTLDEIRRLGEGYFRDDVVWVEYTGLKDKNDKEIYEGDIVKHQLNNAGGEENKTYSSEEVVFDNGAFRNKRGFLIADYGYHQVGNQLYQAEVIGNIWENPDLLESKK